MKESPYHYVVKLNANVADYASKYRVTLYYERRVVGESYASTLWGAKRTAKTMKRKHRNYQARHNRTYENRMI